MQSHVQQQRVPHPLADLDVDLEDGDDHRDETMSEDEESGQMQPLLGYQVSVPSESLVAVPSLHPSASYPSVHNWSHLANGHAPVEHSNGQPPTGVHPQPEGPGHGPVENGKKVQMAAGRMPQRYPREFKKTLAAGVFMLINMTLTGISLALVHELMPSYPPLPDQILDRISYQKWALFGSEHLIQFQTVTACLVILCHKHRWIVARRVFVVVGVLYLYRAITMWVTALPKADPEYYCDPKVGNLTVGIVANRAFKILTGFGLSINGKQVYCGDYIYSGHTSMLVMGYLIVKEYTPKRNLFILLHWLSFLSACASIVLLLLSRGHYTVDVIIAFFITTRSWATYHTVAGHASLRQASNINHFSTFWWFDGICWLERNVKPGKLPYEYNLPWPLKAVCKSMGSVLRRPGRRRRIAGAIS